MKKLLFLLLLSASCLGQQSAFFRAQQSQYAPSLDLNFLTGTLDSRITYTGQNGTRVNNQGLIETAVTNVPRFEYDPASYGFTGQNLLLWSEELGTSSYWSQGAVTVTPNVAVAPDGNTTADKIAQTATNGRHTMVRANIPVNAGTQYTVTFYAKPAGINTVALLFDRPNTTPPYGSVTFNVATGAIVGGGATTQAVSTIAPVGNGWYRCTSRINSGTESVLQLSFIVGAGINPETGDGTSGVYYWGMQLYEGAGVFPYVATTTATIPGTRTATVNRGILIEEPRTNYANYSGDFSNGAWTQYNGSVSSAGYVGKRSGFNAFRFTENTNTSSHALFQTAMTPAISTVTVSCLLRAGTRRYASVRATRNMVNSSATVIVDLVTGVASQTGVSTTGDIPTMAYRIDDWGGGWWRVSLTATYTGTSMTHQLAINPCNAATGTFNAYGELEYTGDGASYIDVDAGQIEPGAFPTSWIYTLGGSVTRTIDAYSIPTAGWYNPSVGTFALRAYTDTPAVDIRPMSIDDGTNGTNRMVVQRNPSNVFQVFGVSGGTSFGYSTSQTVTTGNLNMAFSYQSGTYRNSPNGVFPTGNGFGTGTPLGITLVRLNTSGGRFYINRITYYPRPQQNSYLQLYSN